MAAIFGLHFENLF